LGGPAGSQVGSLGHSWPGDIARHRDKAPDGNPALADRLINRVGVVEVAKQRASIRKCFRSLLER
jgi:hypothetical protein